MHYRVMVWEKGKTDYTEKGRFAEHERKAMFALYFPLRQVEDTIWIERTDKTEPEEFHWRIDSGRYPGWQG